MEQMKKTELTVTNKKWLGKTLGINEVIKEFGEDSTIHQCMKMYGSSSVTMSPRGQGFVIDTDAREM